MASGFRLAFFLCLTGGLLISGTFARCPYGWTSYRSRCFFVPTSLRTAAAAEQYCIALGANLASIHSYWENRLVRILIYRRFRSYRSAWIGLHDAMQERKWMWTDGSRVNYRYWAKGQPNNIGNQDCTEINFGGSRYWNDAGCTHWQPFVCARKE